MSFPYETFPDLPGLVSVDDVSAQLTGLTAAQSAALPAVIAAASRAVSTYCRRVFAATDYDERYTSDSTGRLFLKNRPVISITSITVGTKDNPTPTVLAATDYDHDPATGEVLTGSGDAFWPAYGGGWGYGAAYGSGWPGAGTGRFRDIRIVYRAGYEVEDIPADVRQAVINVIQAMLAQSARNQAVSSISRGGRSISYSQNNMKLVEDSAGYLLDRWVAYR